DLRAQLLELVRGTRLPRRHVPRHAAHHVRRARFPVAESHRAVRRWWLRADAGLESARRLHGLHALPGGGGGRPRPRSIEPGLLLDYGRIADQLLEQAECLRALPDDVQCAELLTAEQHAFAP